MPTTANGVHQGQRWRDEVTGVTLTVTGVIVTAGPTTEMIAIQFDELDVTEYISLEDLLACYEPVIDV